MKFFLSSTYEDLKGFRQVAINLLEELCCEVEAMEYFEASLLTNKEVCLNKLRNSDLMIGIYGRRYGSVDKETGISYTELEYNEAKKTGIPMLCFVLQCPAEEREHRETAFIEKIYSEGILCAKIWKKKDFVLKLNNSLVNYFDGLEGYDYTGIWNDIVAAERKVAANFDSSLPTGKDVDQALNELAAMEEPFDRKKQHRMKLLVSYLKLYRLKDRLLHEPWSEELKKEVLKSRDDYLKIINEVELLDIVDEDGKPTGSVVERGIAHQNGIRHRTSHVWIIRQKKNSIQVLVQMRSQNKDSHPGCFDISSAGHIPAGSDYVPSALRELKEELGVSASSNDLIYCGKRNIEFNKNFHGKPFFDRQISNVYVMWCDREVEFFSVQKSEIDYVSWIELNCCIEKVKNSAPDFPNCISIEELEMVRQYCMKEGKI